MIRRLAALALLVLATTAHASPSVPIIPPATIEATLPAAALAWDRPAHALTITAGAALVAAEVLAAPGQARPRGPLWWLRSVWAQLGMGLAIVGVVMLFMRWRASRQKTYS